MTCRVDPPSFGINCGSISFGQLSGYIVFCILLTWGASHPYRYGTKYNIARNLANRNGATIYAEGGSIYPSLYLALPVFNPLLVHLQIIQLEESGAFRPHALRLVAGQSTKGTVRASRRERT